jgi:cysteine synthase B
MKAANILDTIGKTPLVEVRRMNPNSSVRLFLKLEGFNGIGSVKDRPALYMIRDALDTGQLRPGMTILEATSGNTGIAVSMIGQREGFPVTIVAPRSITQERKEMFEFYGAEVVYTDGPTTKDSVVHAERMVERDPKYFFLNQYANPANPRAHYETTGVEIVSDLPEVDVFVAGLGSSGTLMGVGRRLKEHNPNVKVIAVEPYPGSKLHGLRNLEEDCFIPPILNFEMLDGKRMVRGRNAQNAVLEAGRKEGIFLGMSGGAVLHGALQIAQSMTSGTVVALMADAGWKYLSVGICKQVAEEKADDLLAFSW